MKRPMRRLGCVPALALTAVAVMTAAACSGAPEATPTVEPAPRDSTSSILDSLLPPTESAPPTAYPSSTDPAQIANSVIHWYETGGEDRIIGLRHQAEKAYLYHDQNNWTHDFSPFFEQVRMAEEYPAIPDRTTQAAWSTALEHIGNGGSDIYDATRFGMSRKPEHFEQEARGWKELAQGIKGLKAVDARLRDTFGVTPSRHS